MKKILNVLFALLMFTALAMFTGCPADEEDGGGSGGGGGGSGGGGGEQSGDGSSIDSPIILTSSVWADGSLTANGEQYFKFIANAATQYIHVKFVTLNSTRGLYVQLYDGNGNTVGNKLNLDINNLYTARTLNIGQVYYIKVTPYNSTDTGTYQIAFNASLISPGTVITTLTENTWAEGNVSLTYGEWYKFIATDATQYIYVNFSILKNGLYVQLYNSAGAKILTNPQQLSPSSNKATISNLTAGQEYYINVTPYYSNGGMYQIAFNKTGTAPDKELPSNAAGAIPLTIDKWLDGNYNTTDSEQWYKFTATTSTSYSIHIGFGSLASVYIQLFDSSGNTVGDNTSINSLATNKYISQTLDAGDYYIMLSVPNSGGGSYRIAYSTSTSLPPVELPSTGITTLTADSYTDAEMQIQGTMSDIEQWFKFTATSASHYIHVSFGTFGELTGLYFIVYDGSGNTVFGSKSFTMRDRHYEITTLTPGTTYYIKLWPYNYSNTGTYKIAYNTTILPPDSKTLTVDVLADGNILTPNDEQWFKFIATAAPFQDIYVEFGTLNNLSIQVYDSSGNTVGSSFYLSTNNGKYKNIDVTNGSVYFIRVKSNDSSLSGTYKIAFGTAPW